MYRYYSSTEYNLEGPFNFYIEELSVAKVSSETEISSRMLTCRVTCVALLSESKSQIPTTATHRKIAQRYKHIKIEREK